MRRGVDLCCSKVLLLWCGSTRQLDLQIWFFFFCDGEQRVLENKDVKFKTLEVVGEGYIDVEG